MVVRARALGVLVALVLAVPLVTTGTPPASAEPGAAAGDAPGVARHDRGRRCAGISSPAAVHPSHRAPVRGERLRRCVRLNQVQVLGTHNSYRQATTPGILALLRALEPTLASELEYEHPPLAHQLAAQGVRQLELDVFADPGGGLYARRVGLDVAGLPNDPPPVLHRPGTKVLHIQDLDFNSSCLTFVACLRQVRAWSDRNPGHLPVAVLVELKDGTIPDPGLGFTVPHPIGPAELAAIDAEIRSVFTDDRLITPDDVRGDAPSLEAAVRAGRWPTLREAEGRVLFLMDNGGRHRDDYRAGRPSLEGRVLFTNAEPGSADAAFVKVNEPVGDVDRIRSLVAQGYVVRTRSDVPTVQARTGDRTMLDAAVASGAQWVSTDYPVPGSSPFSDYFADLPGDAVARCNPVNTGPRCVDGLLERLRRAPK